MDAPALEIEHSPELGGIIVLDDGVTLNREVTNLREIDHLRVEPSGRSVGNELQPGQV